MSDMPPSPRRPADTVHDYRSGPDLPSYMTLKELQTLFVFAIKLALETTRDTDLMRVGILVRDRGQANGNQAPWIEFSVGDKEYAFWRRTMDLYAVDEHGAVGDDPIHYHE
jgi:hypothetical protein